MLIVRWKHLLLFVLKEKSTGLGNGCFLRSWIPMSLWIELCIQGGLIYCALERQKWRGNDQFGYFPCLFVRTGILLCLQSAESVKHIGVFPLILYDRGVICAQPDPQTVQCCYASDPASYSLLRIFRTMSPLNFSCSSCPILVYSMAGPLSFGSQTSARLRSALIGQILGKPHPSISAPHIKYVG